MKDTKDITVLVCDNGLFCSLAQRLSRDVARVLYHVPQDDEFPKMNDAFIGHGMEGVELVDSVFGDHFEDVDLFCFFDLGFGPLQNHLVSLGKVVWGARMGEELETCREDCKELLASLELPVGEYKVVKGMEALRDHLWKHKKVFVKISKWRGSFESFYAPDYKSVEPLLDKVEREFGGLKELIDFIVEDELPDKVEIGTDCWTVDGKWPSVFMSGIEVKDKAYVGVFREFAKLPEPLRRVNLAMSQTLKNYGYRGFISFESRIGADGEPYMIDACCRCPSPPSELYQELYTNIAEIIWQGANGFMVDPEPLAKFGAQVNIYSQWADKNWQPIDFPDKWERHIKLREACVVDGQRFIIPQEIGLTSIGSIVGWGNTLDKAVAMVKRVAEDVKGYDVDLSALSAFDHAQAEIEAAEAMGLKMF